jgi:CheY-like chemotaxis protein
MPELNGYDVARRIRAAPWGAEMSLIAATGWGQEKDKREAREAGFDVHLTKPVDAKNLMALIARQVGQRER